MVDHKWQLKDEQRPECCPECGRVLSCRVLRNRACALTWYCNSLVNDCPSFLCWEPTPDEVAEFMLENTS